MKRIFTIIFLALFGTQLSSFAQNELVIEVTTDNNSEETKWVLYDNLNTTIQSRNSFADLTTYRDTIELSSDKCYYWTLYDAYGDGLNGGFNPGSYKIYFGGSLVVQSENANFGDSISVYNLGEACTPNDIGLLDIDMLTFLSKETLPISAIIINMGIAPITSLEMFYTVGNFTSEAAVVDGLNIKVGEMVAIAYPVGHDFNTAGNYTITYTVTKVNGTPDTFTANNSVSKEVTVVDGIVKKNMLEMVTSAYCSSCPEANEMVDNTIALYHGTYSLAKYIPGWWGDLKYIPDNEHRFDLYNVRGAPYFFVNGTERNPFTFSPTVYEDYLGIVSDVKLIVSGYLEGDSIFSTVTVMPMKDVDEVVYLRGVAVQKLCHYDIEDGYEEYHPAYGYLPSPEGFEIQKLTAGDEHTFQFSSDIKDYPLEDGSLQDMILNFYLQKGVNREIIQSENSILTYTQVEPIFTHNIQNNAINVDTANLKVIINSNRILFDNDGGPIVKIQDHLVLKQGTITGTSVPFVAALNEDTTQITITPIYGWNTDTKYFAVAKNFTAIYNLSIPTDTLVFTTIPFVGVSEKILNHINVYPNPAVNTVIITSEKGTAIQILSVSGQVIEEIINGNGTLVHNISTYASGLYFVRINSKNGQQIEKFLKQ